MKKLIVCLAFAAFAAVPAMQAGDSKSCDQAKSSCCADKAKSTAACCSKATTQKADATAKGATLLLAKR